MRVFVTGATGFIGTAVVKELIGAGHDVLGLSRSEAGAKALAAAGAKAHRGSLEDLESLRRGAADSDAVIHLAFIHDFSRFVENCQTDRRVIEALGAALAGSDRPLIVTSGTGMANAKPGEAAREDGKAHTSAEIPRAASEEAAAAIAARGVPVAVVRLPQVHDPVKQGLITYAVAVAREKKKSAYVGDGRNRWPAVHISDAARLYRLVLEKHARGKKPAAGNAGAMAIYHAVAEEGVAMKEIAEVLGRGLKVPVVSLPAEKAAEHFGWLAMFAGRDLPASSALTQERLGWKPTGPGLISDLERMDYSAG
jgi:nucleoside-diphosphate-sugar epimerase